MEGGSRSLSVQVGVGSYCQVSTVDCDLKPSVFTVSCSIDQTCTELTSLSVGSARPIWPPATPNSPYAVHSSEKEDTCSPVKVCCREHTRKEEEWGPGPAQPYQASGYTLDPRGLAPYLFARVQGIGS